MSNGSTPWTSEMLEDAIAYKNEEIIQDGVVYYTTWRECAAYLNGKYGINTTLDGVRHAVKRYRSGVLFRSPEVPKPAVKPVVREVETGYRLDDDDFGFDLRKVDYDFPSPVDPGLNRPDVIRAESVLFICDLHVPYHSPKMLSRAARIAHLMGVDELVIGGDLTDQASVSSHPKNAKIHPLHDELLLTGAVLLKLGALFKRIHICSGNHDERLAKKADVDLRLDGLINYALNGRQPACELNITNFDYFQAEISGQPWRLGHYCRFNAASGKSGKSVAERYGCNVAGGHEHLSGFQSTDDGRYLGISVGSMVDIDEEGRTSLDYVERRLASNKPMRNGFLIIKNGTPFLFDERGSTALNGVRNWEWWLENANRFA